MRKPGFAFRLSLTTGSVVPNRHIDYGIMWIDDVGYATKQRFLCEGLDSDHKWVQYELEGDALQPVRALPLVAPLAECTIASAEMGHYW